MVELFSEAKAGRSREKVEDLAVYCQLETATPDDSQARCVCKGNQYNIMTELENGFSFSYHFDNFRCKMACSEGFTLEVATMTRRYGASNSNLSWSSLSPSIVF
jgi:hypothetical protein